MRSCFLVASFAAMLGAASSFAQDDEVIPPPTGADQGQQGQGTDKTVKQGGDASGATQSEESQATGEDGTQTKKKKSKTTTQDENQQPAEKAAEEPNQKTDDATAQGASKKKKGDDKAQSESDQMTTGSTGKAEITAKDRTVIREKIVTKNVTKVDRSSLNINIAVGVSVPSTLHLVALPSDVIEFAPHYRGYLYFVLDDGTIVVVDPNTHEIIALI
jgi:hypothetical protein